MDIVDKGVVLDRKDINKKVNNKNRKGNQDKNKKRKPSRRLFVVIVLALVGFALLFTFISTRNNSGISVYERYDNLINEEEPFVVVIYDSYSPFGAGIVDELSDFVSELEVDISVLMVLYDIEDEKNHIFTDRYDVEALPVAILCNSKGEALSQFTWPFSLSEIQGEIKKAEVGEGN